MFADLSFWKRLLCLVFFFGCVRVDGYLLLPICCALGQSLTADVTTMGDTWGLGEQSTKRKGPLCVDGLCVSKLCESTRCRLLAGGFGRVSSLHCWGDESMSQTSRVGTCLMLGVLKQNACQTGNSVREHCASSCAKTDVGCRLRMNA